MYACARARGLPRVPIFTVLVATEALANTGQALRALLRRCIAGVPTNLLTLH
jgi:hypothetical protein